MINDHRNLYGLMKIFEHIRKCMSLVFKLSVFDCWLVYLKKFFNFLDSLSQQPDGPPNRLQFMKIINGQ